MIDYRKLIKNIKPKAVLTYTIKPNVYGGLACRISDHTSADGTYGYHDVSLEEFPDEFRTLMKTISDLSKDGLAGAVYTQVSDIEEEINGLLTYDRKYKKSGRIDLDISNRIS